MELTLDDALRAVDRMTDAERDALASTMRWAPLDGPQLAAWTSEADELFYGGAAGGGKTDFVCGLALEQHHRAIVYRRESTQLVGITDRLAELLGGRDMYHGGDRVWRLGDRTIEYGSMPNPGDEQRYQGRPHDLVVFDEVTQFTERMYRYLLTWNRDTDPTRRCRAVVTGNPPTEPEGLWVLKYWGPWLDEEHPLHGKVEPGELVYYVTDGGEDRIVDAETDPVVLINRGTDKERWVRPKSRTFIPSLVEDNPFLMRSGYADSLDALPEPLRSMMREGDFQAGAEDHEWQVCPSAWVKAAQARWRAREHADRGAMSAIGVDCARGGRDKHVQVARSGSFFGRPMVIPGAAVPDGPAGAAAVVQQVRNGAHIYVDVVGVGTSVVDHLEGLGLHVTALHGAAKSFRLDRSGSLKFANLRAEMWWHLRELLDPINPDPIALPPGGEVLADICAPRYKVTAAGVLVESKEELLRPTRLGRSPDIGDAIVYAAHEYESSGLVAQTVLHAQRDDHFDGPYVREVTLRERRGRSWTGFNDAIDYPDDY